MSKIKIKRALISVYDKTGIVDFARALVDEFDIEIISTGGTATLLKENKIPVTLVEEVTGFPEMMDGRVKTLHPKIHAGILADRDNPEHMKQLEEQGIKPIDMVVVNLYPFEKTVADPTCTFEQAIEMIDIGGPCMLRAAAKNHKHVLAMSEDNTLGYEEFLQLFRSGKSITERNLAESAYHAFCETAELDDRLTEYFGHFLRPEERLDKLYHETTEDSVFPQFCSWSGLIASLLRYGENPHQSGSLYEPLSGEWDGGVDTAGLVLGSDVIQGAMSFNNYLDANAALEVCREVTWGNPKLSVAVFIKHSNACGVGVSNSPLEAYRNAYLGDPSAAFGGVLAQNELVTAELAKNVMNTLDQWGRNVGAQGFFIEVWIAPQFEAEAVNAIRKMKKWGNRVRLIAAKDMVAPSNQQEFDFKKIVGGMLVQTRDTVGLNEDQWKVVSKRQPTDREMQDLRLAWLICKHTKSNAITICKDNMLIGNGAGQMSRVMSCRIATWLAKENGHKVKLKGSVAASDAFFPFPDGPNLLIDAGVTAMIQPGGSKRDEDTIAACNERDVAMIFTGTRHFKH